MYNGDTAIVSMQYSFLPSWLSFLVDKENARQAGQALFEAVDEKVRASGSAAAQDRGVRRESRLVRRRGSVPEPEQHHRPHRWSAVLRSDVPEHDARLHHHRSGSGSPEWLPIFDDGANVRFAARAENLGRPDGRVGNPRIVYLQHASDPIAWFKPDLLFAEPDWLREPRGYDVSKDMNWIPVVTFLQVSADMAVAVECGRPRRTATSRMWSTPGRRCMQPPGVDPQKTEQLRGRVTQEYAQ